MRVVSAVIAFILLVFAILHAFVPNHFYVAAAYGFGALLALVTIRKGGMSLNLARVFAVSTTALMFFYFAVKI